jgi:chromosome segregation ATPase
MNKSNKTKREIELEKQIKKLRSEKTQLKKECGSLKSRLETAKRRTDQYKEELKKNK